MTSFVEGRLADLVKRRGDDPDFLFLRIVSSPVARSGIQMVCENEVRGSLSQLLQSPSPRDFLLVQARKCVLETCISEKLPPTIFTVEFSPAFASLEIPSHLFLSSKADRDWIGL